MTVAPFGCEVYFRIQVSAGTMANQAETFPIELHVETSKEKEVADFEAQVGEDDLVDSEPQLIIESAAVQIDHEINQLKCKLVRSDFKDKEALAHFQRLSQEQAQQKKAGKNKSKKRTCTSKRHQDSINESHAPSSLPFRFNLSGESTPSTEEGNLSAYDSDTESLPSTNDTVDQERCKNVKCTSRRSKRCGRREEAKSDLDGNHMTSTRGPVINGLTAEKEAKVHARSKEMKVIASYRRKGQRNQDKKRNSQREFKTHQQRENLPS